MAEYSRIAKGHFTSTGAAKPIYLPFQPDAIELYNFTSFTTPAQHGVPFAYWDVSMGQGFAVENVFNVTPVLTTDKVTVNGFSTFAAGLMLQYGPPLAISGITAASPAVVTTSSAHGLATGDVVILEGLVQSATTGMQQIATIPFVITRTSSTAFSIVFDASQSNFTALSGTPTGANVRKVLYPFLYAPGQSVVTAITTGTTTTVTTSAPNNFVVGQQIAFHIPRAYGTIELNQLPDNLIPGSPLNYYVLSLTSSTVFVCSADTSSATAFNSNQTFASYPGLQFAQVCAVGDVNTGGVQISSGSALYPSPVINGVSTINGPAIQGAFVNNTRQGFVIGAGAGTADSSSVLVGANTNVIYWRAYLSDIAVN